MRIRYMLALAVGVPVLLAWLYVLLAAVSRGRKIAECPACQHNRMRPSWPSLIDRLLGLTGIVPYRCENCRRRYYALKP